MKVILELGDTPAACSLYVNGKQIQNVVEVSASVDIENGPKVQYHTTDGVGEEIHDVEFNTVIEDEVPSVETRLLMQELLKKGIKNG